MSDATREGVRRLADLDVEVMSDPDRIDLVRSLEELKAAAAACQARAAKAFDQSQRRRAAAQGVPPERRGAGVAAQVALALRCSPARGRRFVGFAGGLEEMPAVQAALVAGHTTEYRAFLAVRETAYLTYEGRQAVDAELAARPGGIAALGDLAMESVARGIGERLDPAAAVRRNAAAVRQRRVSLRPAPEGMTRLTGVLPLADGVSVIAALRRAADTARAAGDDRARGALMADELVSRVAGRAAGRPATIELDLVMTDASLFGTDEEPAQESVQESARVAGFGPIPADLARGLVRDADRVWVRRLFSAPASRELVAMESRRRVFDGQLRRFLVIRDETCRTPWCDAVIRHADHVVPAIDAGATAVSNGQGLCESCNYAKTSAPLRQEVAVDGAVVTTTPTGHSYRSPPTPPPGASRRDLVLGA